MIMLRLGIGGWELFAKFGSHAQRTTRYRYYEYFTCSRARSSPAHPLIDLLVVYSSKMGFQYNTRAHRSRCPLSYTA